ncbi:MAG: hypothetical protein EBR82_29640 [Caulobacteraceae bacterium]|nr:hypothetical protein [Caulobacteraceae bacterium]
MDADRSDFSEEVTLDNVLLAIESTRGAFAFATTAIGKDKGGSGVAFAGRMLDEALSVFHEQLVQFFKKKMQE